MISFEGFGALSMVGVFGGLSHVYVCKWCMSYWFVYVLTSIVMLTILLGRLDKER